MRLLADTNLFVRFCNRLPMPEDVEAILDDMEAERCLPAISVVEIYRLWQKKELPDNPDSWLFEALADWTVLPVTAPIARLSVLWPWDHRDPADRIIAATAKLENAPLYHTDTVLKGLGDFPHHYRKRNWT